jgi:hypothetical protein
MATVEANLLSYQAAADTQCNFFMPVSNGHRN